MNKSHDKMVQFWKARSRLARLKKTMKMLRKLALVGVALATLSLATPAQAFWWPFLRGRVVVAYPGYYAPAYYGYYNPYYYGYYGPAYYGGYYGYYGRGYAFGGHGYNRGGYRGYGGYGGYRGGGGHGGGHR